MCFTFVYAHTQSKDYQFEVANITTYSEAKPIIALLRKAYNNESNPRAFLPNFIDESNLFVVSTDVQLVESEFESMLALEGYQLISFKFSTTNSIHNEKE